MDQAIIVAPSADGWAVKSPPFSNEMFFRSGESAEIAARALGMKMAQASVAVVIDIFLRDGSLGGRYVWAERGWRAL
jgi:hypothetical protein